MPIQAEVVNTPDKGFWTNLWNNIQGKPNEILKLPTTNPFQQNILNQLSKMGLQGLQRPDTYGNLLQNLIRGGQGVMGSKNLTPHFTNPALQALNNPYEGFAPIEQQAQRQFSQQTVPSLAERFTALGGGQRSSAFQGALGSAASDLESQLAALRSQYGMQNKQFGANLLGQGGQYQLNRENSLQNLLGMGANYSQNQQTNFQRLLGLGLQSPPFQYLTQQGTVGLLGQLGKLGTNIGLNYMGLPPIAGGGGMGSPDGMMTQMPNLSVNRLGGVS